MKRTHSPARLLAALALSLLPALVAGCSSDSGVLARVGDRTITRQDFADVAGRNPGAYTGRPEVAKAALLDDLVKRELLVLEAVKRGLVDPAERARLAQQTREQLVLRALFGRVVPREVPVSDAEVTAFYRQRSTEAHLQIIFTVDRAGIDAALGEVRRGGDFGAVADRWNMSGMVPPHGDLGFVMAGSLAGPLDRWVVAGRVGEVIGPIESMGDGWFLLKVLERRPRAQEPLAEQRDGLREMLVQRKQRGLLITLQRELLAQYRVRLEPGAAQALFMRYNQPRDTVLVGSIRMPVPAPPTSEEARRVLVRYDGPEGRPVLYTLADAIQDLQDATRMRPNFSMVPVIEQWLKTMALQRVALIEAQRRHLHEEPDVVRQVRQRVDNVLLETAYASLVINPTTVTEDELRAEYERRAASLAEQGKTLPPFARLEADTRQTLEAETLEQKRARRLDQLMESLRRTYRPVAFPERLARIPWPVAPAAPQMPGT